MGLGGFAGPPPPVPRQPDGLQDLFQPGEAHGDLPLAGGHEVVEQRRGRVPVHPELEGNPEVGRGVAGPGRLQAVLVVHDARVAVGVVVLGGAGLGLAHRTVPRRPLVGPDLEFVNEAHFVGGVVVDQGLVGPELDPVEEADPGVGAVAVQPLGGRGLRRVGRARRPGGVRVEAGNVPHGLVYRPVVRLVVAHRHGEVEALVFAPGGGHFYPFLRRAVLEELEDVAAAARQLVAPADLDPDDVAGGEGLPVWLVGGVLRGHA